MAETTRSKEKLGRPASSERKASDETMKRFRGFVKNRATEQGEADADGVKSSKGLFEVKSTIGEIAPVGTSIEYQHIEYEDGGPVGQEEDIQFSLRVGDHEVFGLFVATEDEGRKTDIVDGEGESLGDKTDAIVNGVISAVERMEAEGVITASASQE